MGRTLPIELEQDKKLDRTVAKTYHSLWYLGLLGGVEQYGGRLLEEERYLPLRKSFLLEWLDTLYIHEGIYHIIEVYHERDYYVMCLATLYKLLLQS